MKRLVLLTLLGLAFATARAQSVPQVPDKQATLSGSAEHPISIQLHAGTQGLGLDARYGLTPRVSLRLGGSSMIPIKVDNALDFNGFQSDNSLKGEFSNIHLFADLSPFKTSVFKFVAGAGYLFKANGNIQFAPVGNYTFGGLELTPQEIGDLNVDFSWKGLAPYAGIGLFKSFPQRTFNVNLDLGTYFLTAAKSTVTGTKMLANNGELEPQFDSNMKDYRFLPVIQLNFNFKIK